MRPDDHSGHVIYKSGRSIALEFGCRWDPLPGPSPRSERFAAQEAVWAVGELCRGLVDPLEFGVTRFVVDESDYLMADFTSRPRLWHWYLRKTGSSPRAVYVDPVVIEAETIDRSAMPALVDTALGEPCDLPEGQWPAWQELYVRNTRARLPESAVPADGGDLVIDDYDNGPPNLRVPVERRQDGTWVGSPGLGTWNPIALRVFKPGSSGHPDAVTYDEFIELDIDVHWSLWWEEGSPGRAMLDQALGRLHRRGWRLARQPG